MNPLSSKMHLIFKTCYMNIRVINSNCLTKVRCTHVQEIKAHAKVFLFSTSTLLVFSENWIDMWSRKTTNTKISPPGVPRLANLLPIALMMSESDPRFHFRFLNLVQYHFSTCNFHQMMMKTTFKRGCMYLQGDKDWFRSSAQISCHL